MALSSPSEIAPGWSPSPALEPVLAELAREVRAGLSVELARRGLDLRVDLVGEAEQPEIDIRADSEANAPAFRSRFRVTAESAELQVRRLADRLSSERPSRSGAAEPRWAARTNDLWCAPE